MIFCTVGSTNFDFSRLVKKMDDISKSIDEKVVLQIGGTKYTPKYAEYFKFKSRKEIGKYYNESKIIVGHAGTGTIITAFRYNKPIIIVPRRKKFNEAVDDHQLEIAKKLEDNGMVIVVYDINNLKKTLEKKELYKKNMLGERDELIRNLKRYLSLLSKKKW